MNLASFTMKAGLLSPVFAWLLAAFAARSGAGAIHPSAFHIRAPEALEAKIERVVRGRDILVLVRARVTAVRRTTAGVRVGDSILIRYELDLEDIARRRKKHEGIVPALIGGQFLHEPDPPRAGEDVVVYLALEERTEANKDRPRAFCPAAYQYSFVDPASRTGF